MLNDIFRFCLLYWSDYIGEKIHEQLIEMAKRMLEDNALSLEKIAEYSGLELAEVKNLEKMKRVEENTSILT